MPDNYYTTGAAAKTLGMSSYHLRRLCETGILQAELTEGGHWRIPASEVARLKLDGIPPIPQTLTEERASASQSSLKSQAARQGIGVLPSEELISSGEDVTITENRLRKRKVEREAEEVEDWFREREKRWADQATAERRAAMEATAQARHWQWENKWSGYALSRVPRNTPPEIKIGVHDQVQTTLEKLGPDCADKVVKQLVQGAVDRGLESWRRHLDSERAILRSIDRLPVGAKSAGKPTKWQLQATEEARRAVRQLKVGAPLDEVEVAATRAVERITQEFEWQQLCMKVVQGVSLALFEETVQVIDEAKEAVEKAVAVLPVGATWRDLERARDQVLKPVKDAIADRRNKTICEEALRSASWKFPFGMDDQLKRQAVDSMNAALKRLPVGTPRNEISKTADLAQQPFLKVQQVRKKKKCLIAEALREIYPHVTALSKIWEFDESPWNLARELTHAVGEELQQQLSGEETLDAAKKQVRRIVNYELDIDDP